MLKRILGSAFACLALSQIAYSEDQILEILNDTFPLPNENAAQVNIRNHANFDVTCTVRVAAKIQGRHPATGLILSATSDSDPVVGFVLKAKRNQFRKFDFTKSVTQLRQVWGDPSAIVTEVDQRSIISDCKRVDGLTNETPTLKSLGYSVDNSSHPRPADFDLHMARGVSITPDEHDCYYWVKDGQIFAFPDGVVYTGEGSSTYQVYEHAMARSYGCKVPPINGQFVGGMIAEPMGNAYYPGYGVHYAPTLESLGYKTSGWPQNRGPNFLNDMKLALRIEPKDHKCAWAARPLIYVFPDGVVYARASSPGYTGTDFYFFPTAQVEAAGCFVPTVVPVDPGNR